MAPPTATDEPPSLVNTMDTNGATNINDVDAKDLSRFIDPEFLDAKPDKRTRTVEQALTQEKEELEDPPDLLDDFEVEENTRPLALQPREYQYELYLKAVEENVIAVLDTGSGKTLIAVMLIKTIAAQEREERMKRRHTKLTFFLVDRVPLVFQQTEVIATNCDVNVKAMCGQMDVDNWTEKQWRQIFEENDVCVMTAQIFLDTLRHGYVHMDKVNLIIFDECHHATKRHPYNLIMQEFYHHIPANEDRPKIFGMTASPMHAKSGVQYSAMQLERNLDSRIYTATNVQQLLESVNRPKEISLYYAASRGYERTPLTTRISEKIGVIDRYRRCFDVAAHVLDHLGPWCCDRLWRYMLEAVDGRVLIDLEDVPKEQMEEENRALSEAYKMTENAAPDNPDFFNSDLFTGKVQKLLHVLRTCALGMNDFCGIIFVERRHTAVALYLLIQACHFFADHNMRCDVLIGHGTKEDGDVQMKFKDQNSTIKRFRNGELNLLIATNVAEEGLDIQPCNIVIRFDFFNTLIGYIQSRGRARQPNSKYVILMEENNESQKSRLDEFRDLESEMKDFCRELPDERNMASKYADSMYPDDEYYESDDDDDEFSLEHMHIVLETKATVTLHSSVPLIHRYCGSLPSDSFTILQPVFEIYPTADGFSCTLRLPSNAAVKEVHSEIARTKARAKRLAALKACRLLHSRGALDNHLMPKAQKREMLGEMAPQYDENGFIIGSRRRRGVYEKCSPRFWEREQEEEEDQEEETADEKKEALMLDTKPSVIEKRLRVNQDNPPTGDDNSSNDQLVPTQPDGNGCLVPEPAHPNGANETKAESPKVDDPMVVDSKPNGSVSPKAEESTVVDPKPNGDVTQGSNSTATKDVDASEESEEPPADIGPGPFDVWITSINLEPPSTMIIPVRRLVLVTWKPLPTIPEFPFFSKGTPFTCSFKSDPASCTVDRETIDLLADFTLRLTSSITNKNFECPLIDFPYFLAPLKSMHDGNVQYTLSSSSFQESVDWEGIRRTIHFKGEPVDVDNLEQSIHDRIIIDSFDSSRRYLVRDIRNDLHPFSPVPSDMNIRETGFETFAAFYQETWNAKVTKPDQPLVQVQRINKVMNYMMAVETVAPIEKKRTATFVVPEFCILFPINASIYQSAMFLPSLMSRLDSYLLVKEATQRYDLPVKDDLILEAYTTPSASMAMNYERLETLGDSLLKFLATIRLYINFPFSNEGELHCLRIRVICNRALYRAAKRLKIFRYVTSHAFNRRYWRPHHFTTPKDTPDTLKEVRRHMLSDKTLADIVEATLGAAYLSSGLEGGLKTAIAMQIPFDEIQQWSDFTPTFLQNRDKVPARAEARALRSLSISRVQELTGYTFNTPLLVVEALTHASLPNSTAPCYQRLEFLGDAILDFLVIRYLFTKYPEADPGMITDLKDSCVNNHVLSIICVENMLHTQIIHYSGRLVRSIEEFCKEVEDMKKDGRAVGEYWRDLMIPKVLSDVVESMLGAIFVDAGFNLAPVEKLFEKWMHPLFDKHVTPDTLQVHPLRRLTTDLQRLGCEGFMLRNFTTESNAHDSQKCVIFLHDQPLASGSSDNVKAARRNAATKAVARLQDDPEIVNRICDCGILRRKRKKVVYVSDDEEIEVEK